MLTTDLNKETDQAVYFYTPPFYALDNFSAYIVEIWGKKFQTSEHAYQWKKYISSHPEIAEQIFNTKNPSEAKKISDAHKQETTFEFDVIKLQIMEEILREKVSQNEHVKKVLKDTGGKDIIENSPIDSFWGVGPDGTGQNVLGKLWMKIRDDLLQ